MRFLRATAIGVLVVSVLALGGCRKRKPALPPPQAQAPVITEPQPETQPPPPVVTEPTRPQPETPPETVTPPPVAPAPKPKPKPRRAAKKTPPPAEEKPAEPPPSKTVVSEGGAQPATPQLSASMPHDEVIHQRLSTAQLLEATDYNLKSITRQFSADEAAMVQHIRSYMQQSRDATKEGDTERAYNLALKAHLLSDELVKR